MTQNRPYGFPASGKVLVTPAVQDSAEIMEKLVPDPGIGILTGLFLCLPEVLYFPLSVPIGKDIG